jgi:chemotaxis protein methyltransferase CheR
MSMAHLKASQDLFARLQQDLPGFLVLSRLLKELAGINLPDNLKNLSLMASRLAPVLKARGLGDYGTFARLLKSGDQEAITEFVSALTTNTTHFFREGAHFQHLSQALPAILERKRKSGHRELRIWCAAASTGQEPYTIAMTVLGGIPDAAHWDIRFLATDIDPEVLSRASLGQYNESEMAGVPPLLRQKYFQSRSQIPTRKSPHSEIEQVVPGLSQLIRFAPLNLMSEKYPFQHPFDIIFCRNVLIYFEAATASAVVHRLGTALGAGGLLYLGHSESGTMKSNILAPVGHAVYQRKAAGVK